MCESLPYVAEFVAEGLEFSCGSVVAGSAVVVR